MELRARISAVIDTDLTTVFRPLIEDSKRARQAVVEQARGMGQGVATAAQQAAQREREVFQATHELQMTMLKARMSANKNAAAQEAATKRKELELAQKSASDQLKIEADIYKQKEKLRAADQQAQQRYQAQAALAQQRHQQRLQQQANAEQQRSGRQKEDTGPSISGRSMAAEGMRSFASTVRAGVGVASQIARGAGVNFDLSSMIGKSVDLEKRSVDLSNAGYQPGQGGAKDIRQDPAKIIKDIKEAANASAVDINTMAEGLQKFVSKTGELELGRQIIGSMGKLARATGSDVGDMVDAAGDVAANLDDQLRTAENVDAVMRSIAGQGKLGAVEIKDMATQMAKLASKAPMFEGSVVDNMAKMGALVQEARQRGGAASATQAATSLSSFVSTFSKGARRNAFKAAGVEIENKDGQLLSPEEIIINSLRKTKGSKDGMGKLFSDAGARRVTTGFETIYKEAGGGEKGEKAVREEFNKLIKAQMSEQEVTESFNRSMQTAEAKAQLFQNQLQEVASSLAGRVLPALELWGPRVIAMAEGAASFVEKLATLDPGQLLMATIGASIAQAAIGEGIKALLNASLAGSIAGIAAVTIATAIVSIHRAKVEDDVNKVNRGSETYDAYKRLQDVNDRLERAQATTGVSREKLAAAQEEEDQYAGSKSTAGKEMYRRAVKKRLEAEREVKENLEKEKPLKSDFETEVTKIRLLTDKADEITNTQNNTANSYGYFTGTGGASGGDQGGASGNISGMGPDTGGASRSDQHIATALSGMRDSIENMVARQRALEGKEQLVRITNLPIVGVDPTKRTGPDGRRR